MKRTSRSAKSPQSNRIGNCNPSRNLVRQSKLSPNAHLLELAVIKHNSGLLDQAEALYKQILKREPEHPDALNLLGLIAHQKGQPERAIALMKRSIESHPGCANYLVNLGRIYATLEDFDSSLDCYRRAIALDPKLASAFHEMGSAFRNQGKLVEAAKSYIEELSITPEAHQTINLLGTVLQQLGKMRQAAVCYRKAIAIDASNAQAHSNLGQALLHLGQLNEAVESCQRAIDHSPALAEAHCNLGNALNGLGNFQEGVKSCERALTLHPDFKEAHLTLGNAFKGLGQLSDAAVSYRRAISLSQNYAGAHVNLAEILKEQGKLQEAVESLENALRCTPTSPAAYSNLLNFHAFTRHISPAAERLLAEGWEKAFLTENERLAARRRSSPTAGTFAPRPRTGRKLRLGILTAELGSRHPVSFFMDPILKELDRSRFDLTIFATRSHLGPDAERLQQLLTDNSDSFIQLQGVSDAEAAEMIRSEQIDVLIETTGHTSGCRLGIVAHRAAPVQCSYVGYWSVIGLTEMDWFIVGTGCDASLDAHFTEGLWRLPRYGNCYNGDASLPENGWAPDPDGTIWLGSFNNNAKIREETLSLWAKVLQALPEAKLLFEDRGIRDEETHQRIISTLSGFGIDAKRIEFIPFVKGHERHMRMYNRLDIALDTIPFNSGTTAFDALWMGAPLITIKGDWLGGTLAGSAVTALDHPEWLAKDTDEYVSIVCSLARDVEGRKELRAKQRARMAASPLCDAKGMTLSLEDAADAMYDHWLTGSRRPAAGGDARREIVEEALGCSMQ